LASGGPGDRRHCDLERLAGPAKMAGMDANKLFEMALGVGNGWRVVKSEMNVPGRQLQLWLDFAAGSQFACPQCGEWCGVHDTAEKSWRHLNFWQHQTELHARCPRVKCEEHGVLQAELPWARAGSGFTLMMEAMIVLLCQQMPVAEVARMLGVHDTQLWRVLTYHVERAQAGRDWSGVKRILVDETSAKRGHRYVTNFVDAESRELLFMVEGRKAEAFAAFAEALQAHGGDPKQIELISMDMSPAYRAGAEEFFQSARIVYDRFHLMQMAGQALDEVRKSLRRAGADLAGGLWALRGNAWTRSEEQQQMREALCRQYPKLGRAMMLREMLQDALAREDEESLRWWCRRAMRSRLEPFRKLAKTIRAHWDGVVAFLETRVTNGLIEAINGLLQLAKRMARGFRSFRHFQIMAYLKAAKLKPELPAVLPT
jgi:transposase